MSSLLKLFFTIVVSIRIFCHISSLKTWCIIGILPIVLHYNFIFRFKPYSYIPEIITKWGNSYYKVGQLLLLQSGAKFITKWGSFFITKWGKIYYKVGQVLQSGAMLLQSGAGITKWGNYYKVGHNNCKGYLYSL